MEEAVGKLWHRWITGLVRDDYPEAAVELAEIEKALGLYFRALGGEAGIGLHASHASQSQKRGGFLRRVAYAEEKIELTWVDDENLHLPQRLSVFPEQQLNQDLYYWLTALAAQDKGQNLPWFNKNQLLSQHVLDNYAGLHETYERLVEAQIALWTEYKGAKECKQALIQALQQPNSVEHLPFCADSTPAMYLWLHPEPPCALASQVVKKRPDKQAKRKNKQTQQAKDTRRRQAERVENQDSKSGLLAFRLESLFSLADFIKVDRTCDEEQDISQAQQALDDVDKLSISRDQEDTEAATLSVDLELSRLDYDAPLAEAEIYLPEWHYKKAMMQPDYCCLNQQPIAIKDDASAEIPAKLRPFARRLRQQFAALQPQKQWYKAQADGCEIDLEAYMHQRSDALLGKDTGEHKLYQDYRGKQRDLSCLLLADLSLSTDAWVNNEARVIDAIKDSLCLFAEALSASGDQFALYGFHSNSRHDVQLQSIKSFSERHQPVVQQRIASLSPQNYTRMGAAIRQATRLLSEQKSEQRLLLLLTDGKPNDIDVYEGRYGIEDTRMSLLEARRQGLQVFCITIDEKANDYLPHIFGQQRYVLIHNPADLPKELPLLYLHLTRSY